MNAFRTLLLVTIAALPLATVAATDRMPVNGAASAQPMTRKPVMVVRFNQPRINYERQLYGMLDQVVHIKPDVLFDIVAVAPEGEKARVVAAQNGQRVISSMMRMGVPQSRISYAELSDPTLYSSEVRIFVR